MASKVEKPQKIMKRIDSKKSHSWWWDSHVSPKNNKWLAENLEEMDESVKRMLKLIEGDGDSFAKKADLYYQKRPQLISHVEEFYRMYRSLAERYDHVTGELRRNIPSDLQSTGSGVSDIASEPSAISLPESKPARQKTRPRAAGFEFFLGTGSSSSDICQEGDETSTTVTDSGSDNDDDDSSSVNNYSAVASNAEDLGMRRRIIELEVELRDVKEKLITQQSEENLAKSPKSKLENYDSLLNRIGVYEEELRSAKENIRISEEEISQLRHELGKYKPINGFEESHSDEEVEISETDPKILISKLEKEIKISKEKLVDSEKVVENLKTELATARKENSSWKSKLDKEKREITKMLERIARYKSNIADRDQEIRRLRETVSNANASLSEENFLLQTEVTRLMKERSYLEDNLKELDLRSQSLESAKSQIESERDELSLKITILNSELESKETQIQRLNKHLEELHLQHVEMINGIEMARQTIQGLRSKVSELEKDVLMKQSVILEGAEEKREAIRQLCFSIEHYRDEYHQLRQVAFAGNRRIPVAASS